MARKIVLTGILIMLLAAGGVSAHEKGDLILNLEPQVGIAFPSLPWMFNYGMIPGIDFGLRGTVHYYFTNSFSVNTGLGYAGNYHWFYNKKADEVDGIESLFADNALLYILIVPLLIDTIYMTAQRIPKQIANQITAEHDTFFASYLTIPFGIRYEIKAFALGAGLTGNIPLYGYGETETKDEGYFVEPLTFDLKPYLGWYFDIGFSAKKFGMAFRLSGAFARETVEVHPEWIKENYDPFSFNFLSMSLVFQFRIPLAKLPIKDKKQKKTDNDEAMADEEMVNEE